MLRDLQMSVVSRIKADPIFADIPVVAATKGDLASTIEAELGKLGVCVTVEPVRGTLKHVAGKLTTEPSFQLHVFENVLINRAREAFVSADDLAMRVCWLLRSSQEDPPPAYAISWELVNDMNEEVTYRVEATTRKPMELAS